MYSALRSISPFTISVYHRFPFECQYIWKIEINLLNLIEFD